MPIQSDNPPELMTLDQFKGLNQQSRQGSIDDQEEWWNENFFAVGPGSLRTCWGHGPAIYTAPPGLAIFRIFFGTYGNQTPQFQSPPPGAMGWMFLSDGTIEEVDLNTGQVTGLRAAGPTWGPLGTPEGPYLWASAKVWRPQFFGSSLGQQGGVLFGSPAGLYAWDGSTLSKPGDPAPDWLTDLQETDPGGTPPPMPEGLPGIYAMEVYNSRLWVAGKDVMSFSAPSNGADFSTTNGGGSFGYFGDKLAYSYVDLHAVAGYLFVFGDSSTDLISNVTLAGSGTPESPYTTNFNYENIDPQVGQRFPRPVGVIGRQMVMFNDAGFFLMQGGDAQPIGEKVTNLWLTLDITQYLPTFASATMFGFRVLLCNGRFTDPFGVSRSLMLMYHPSKGAGFWSVASQGLELTNIGHYEQDSRLTPYGTDGTSLYQLFAQPDETLAKRYVTKRLRGEGIAQLQVKNFKRIYAEIDDNDGRGVSLTGHLATGDGGIPGGVQSLDFELTGGVEHKIIPQPVDGHGIWGAIDLISRSPDFTLERLHVAAEERTLYGA
ncbi:MAG TPA: hypothetical protein VHT52_12320 [Stellaceae bacterium]|jgi:hypothetical protein|nr:hypothetical protein [Stellaceae bacterium]